MPDLDELNQTQNQNVSEAKTTSLIVKNVSTGSKIFSYFTLLIFVIGFYSLLSYVTQPKKFRKSYTNAINELSDYLLIKEEGEKKEEIFNVRDF